MSTGSMNPSSRVPDPAGGPAEAAGGADELYVGYLPAAPPRVARFVRRVVPGLLVLAASVAALLAALQGRFDPGAFAFGEPRWIEGTLRERPYPALLDARAVAPGESLPGGAVGSTPRLRDALLVRQGKHGAAGVASGLDGRRVRLEATPIESPLGSMLELVPGTLEPLDGPPSAAPARGSSAAAPADVLGTVELTGEIVDSKCFLGVMKPGKGKPHLACAARCISGGIPPALLVEAADGSRRLLLLAGHDGAPMAPADVVDLVGEPVTAKGVVERGAGGLLLRVDAGGLRSMRN